MIVAGVMSGTSADGINVALVQIAGSSRIKLKLIGHLEAEYPKKVRKAILAAMNAKEANVADLARLNFLLAELYSEAVINAQRKFRVKVGLVGCHGQTLYHQGDQADFLGRKISATWQTGEGSVIAARVGVPVVSDFRPADLAAHGKGAPFVPFLDAMIYGDRKVGRILQNIGGIANLTALPANAKGRIVAFDTGPGNMVIDAVTDHFFNQAFDRNGQIAAMGSADNHVVKAILRRQFFLRKPPKTAGREEFGREFVADFVRLCGRVAPADVVATATALTSSSIAESIRRFLLPSSIFQEIVVSGGGTRNPTLMAALANDLRPLNIAVRMSDEFGIPSEAKEAVAFALLAYQTWHRRPSNVPAATGAARPAILGKVSYA